jgi:mycothiol synthase
MTMGFDRQPLASGDVKAWAALLEAIRDADGDDDYASELDLLEAFSQPDQEFARGSIAIYDGLTMVGYGVLTRRSAATSRRAGSTRWSGTCRTPSRRP